MKYIIVGGGVMPDVPVIKRRFFKMTLVVITVLGILAVLAAIIFLPNIVDYYQSLNNRVLSYSVVIFLWMTAVPLLLILVLFLKLSLSLLNAKIFMKKSIREITAVQWCLLAEILFYIYASVYFRSILAIVVFFGTVLCEVFASVLRELLIDGKEYYNDSIQSI